ISYNGSMMSLLAELPKAYRVVLGVEMDPTQPQPEINIDVRDAIIDDVMDALVRAKPNYLWRKNGSFFELLPANQSTPLLETRIHSFTVTGATETDAIDQLLALPEVRDAMKSQDLRLTPWVGHPKIHKPVRLVISDVTLRTALDMI